MTIGQSRRAVVGAAIVDDRDQPRQVLAARRTRPPELAGLWEFPGGKVEPGESHSAAVQRELLEELSIHVAVGPLVAGALPINDTLELYVYWAELRQGQLRLSDSHDQLSWMGASELEDDLWAPADRPLLKVVRQRLRSASHLDVSG